MKQWEQIFDALRKDGWSVGFCSAIGASGNRFHIADAVREGKRIVIHADDLTSALRELQTQAKESNLTRKQK